MSSRSNSFTVQQARATAAIAGIQKYYSTTATMVMAGVSYTPAGLISLLQAYVNAITALQALHAQLSDAVLGVQAQKGQINTILLDLESFVTNAFGRSSSKLGDFGFTPRKRGVPSVQTKAQAQVKSKATRKARGTLGSKQKLSITGGTNGTTTTAAAQPAANGSATKV
jgi:hypothetical protein